MSDISNTREDEGLVGTAATPDADEARRRLAEAGSRRLTSTRDLRILQTVTVGVGALMAALVVVVAAVDSGVGILVAMLVYAAGLSALLWWNSRVGAVPRGYARRYNTGIAATSVMYSVGVVLVATQPLAVGTVLALAAATLLPAALAAIAIGRAPQS